jgi:hypothetical protein
MISFRVSEDEYAGLKTLCITEGARSVSDMARDAVQRLMNNRPAGHHQADPTLQVLQHKLEALDREVKRLCVALEEQTATASVVGRNGNAD